MWRERVKARGLASELVRGYRFTIAVLMVVLLLTASSMSYLLLRSQPRISDYVEMTSAARELNTATLRGEVAITDWLGTRDKTQLERYDAARQEQDRALAELRRYAALDAEVSVAMVDTLLSRAAWQAWAEDLVESPPSSDRGVVRRTLDEGRLLSDQYDAHYQVTIDLLKTRRREALSSQMTAMELFLVGYAVTIGVAVYVAWSRRRALGPAVLTPIAEVLGALRTLRQGDLEVRTGRSGVTELDEVGGALDELASQLAQARTEGEVREARLSSVAEGLDTVVRVGKEIAGSLSTRYVTETVARAASALVSAETVLWVSTDGQLRAARRSSDPHGVGPPSDLAPDPLLEASAREARVMAQDSIRAHPLVYAGSVVGVLEVHRPSLDEDTEQVLEALLSTAAASLESARLHANVREMAEIDALTQLANRRRFETELHEEWERSVRYDRPLSVLMLDLDRFKLLNDTHGHLVGDEVLRSVGKAISEALRTSDTVYRYGGEEIVVLLRETGAEEATAVAERIRATIAAVRLRAGAVSVTASVGVAQREDRMAAPAELVMAADVAMYNAKQAGRDRVVTVPPSHVPDGPLLRVADLPDRG